MAEQIDLTSPEQRPAINTTFYRVVRLVLDWRLAHIAILIQGENGELKSFTYEGAEATALMVALNKANLTTNSLQKRVLNRLIADGKLSGAVTGTPD